MIEKSKIKKNNQFAKTNCQKSNENFYSFIGNSQQNWVGFTLIELLVVMSIIAILIALSGFGLQGARESSRDAKRRSDLETIRSGLELFRSDCNRYPTSAGDGFYDVVGASLADNDGGCSGTGSRVYIQKVPTDALTAREYYYNSAGASYQLCAALESGGTDSCSGACGGSTCNYKTTNP